MSSVSLRLSTYIVQWSHFQLLTLQGTLYFIPLLPQAKIWSSFWCWPPQVSNITLPSSHSLGLNAFHRGGYKSFQLLRGKEIHFSPTLLPPSLFYLCCLPPRFFTTFFFYVHIVNTFTTQDKAWPTVSFFRRHLMSCCCAANLDLTLRAEQNTNRRMWADKHLMYELCS